MKLTATALFLGALTLTSPLAYADIIDDAIGNIQQALGDAYQPHSDRVYHDDREDDDSPPQDAARDSQYDARYRQLEARRRQLDDRQRQLDQERRQIDDQESQLREDYDR